MKFDEPALQSFIFLCFLLVLGKILRMKVHIFQRLYLPSSVIGGLIGLTLLQLASLNDDLSQYLTDHWIVAWDKLAGFLINIVFSALFLGVHIPRASTVWNKAGPQLMYGMVVAWGQWFTAVLVTAVVLKPVFGVHDLFAAILPIGFAGGHGTAAGLSDTFDTLGFPEGGDFGLASATVGLVLSILLGVLWVNVAAHKGWVKKDKMDKATDAKLSIRAGGIYPVDQRPTAGVQTVSPDSIDTLALHLAIIGIAMTIGYVVKLGLVGIESTSSALEDVGFLSGFPLFPLCMGGGILIQWCAERFNTETKLIDASLMERLSGTSLDFLITAAVASVNVDALSNDLGAFAVLICAGILWHCICLGLIARHLLPNHWFERGAAEMGMSMGVIASGLVLLRMVDPESKSPVPADFAYKQLLHSPIMGGGIWTCLALPILAKAGIWPSLIIVTVIFVGWILSWKFYFQPRYHNRCNCAMCSEGASSLLDASLGESLLTAEEGGAAFESGEDSKGGIN